MSDRGIRVAALMEAYWVTGPAKNLIEFARLAKDPGFGLTPVNVTIITYNRAAGDSAFASAAKGAGVPTRTVFERRRFDTGVLLQLREVISDCRPDIIQTHNVKSHFFVRLLGLYRNYPWIAVNHGYTVTSLMDRLYSQLDWWSLRAAHGGMAVCGPFAREMERRGVRADRIHIQHNSVRPFEAPSAQDVLRARSALGLRPEEAVALVVGRLSHEKGHAELLSAIARLVRTEGLPAFRIVFAGSGPERERLGRIASALGVGNRIILAGHQTDLRPFYAMATMVVLPSHSEGSPNVVLEAMAAGVPVAATAVGGVPEILEHERTGLLVPRHNPEAMAAAIGRLLGDEELRLRLASAARERVAERYTPEEYKRSMIVFYEQVLASFHEAPSAGSLPALR